ncbi:DNA cytosine methyltransferase [Williamsia sp. DF01-3]|uniref:DNA cytosine methyltransferase n=1 Tax=Williamsia sp. DF01-3 TaxID=2934157 RepID=UPI001FF120FA|nr:DNA cytosine methyltransferase [Williamsia sp. DF01-3]MCK0517895.1 DNA cytosine methyltransferase [Williamsia sp. DF01-3]
MRIGSLFSGYGGLDIACEAFFDATTAWHVEHDAAPSKVLAHHWPGVPNHGDVTAIDWADVEPVDILTGGYPCQPFSAAGRRKGTNDERHLWPYVREAIRHLRPRFTVLENVAGHRSMGFDRVLGDCAEDGLHVRWVSVRASDVGACHRRERLFILVTDPDRDTVWQQPITEPRSESPAVAGWDREEPVALLPTPHANLGEHRRDTGQDPAKRRAGGHQVSLADVLCFLPTPSVADGTGGHLTRSGARSDELLLPGVAKAYAEGKLLPTPRATDGTKGGPNQRGSSGDLMLPSAVMRLLPTPEAKLASAGPDFARMNRPDSGGHDLATAIAIKSEWGEYAPAIARQEALSRTAPPPTEPNTKGNPRLSAAFPEWMMFLPAGWVTDPAIGLTRNEQLRAIGNGVVPPQAYTSLGELTSMVVAA